MLAEESPPFPGNGFGRRYRHDEVRRRAARQCETGLSLDLLLDASITPIEGPHDSCVSWRIGWVASRTVSDRKSRVRMTTRRTTPTREGVDAFTMNGLGVR